MNKLVILTIIVFRGRI